MDIMGKVKAAFGTDRDIAGIVAAAEEICTSLAQGEIPGAKSTATVEATLEATFTEEPAMSETPTPTAMP
jgi:hypothetical protein